MGNFKERLVYLELEGRDLYEDALDQVQKKNGKKRKCSGCGKSFMPVLKIDYCCNICKKENHIMYEKEFAE